MNCTDLSYFLFKENISNLHFTPINFCSNAVMNYFILLQAPCTCFLYIVGYLVGKTVACHLITLLCNY